MRRAEAKNHDEDPSQEEQAEDRSRATTKSLSDTDVDQDDEDDIDQGDQKEKTPPPWLAANLWQEEEIDNGNDCKDPRNTRLAEHLPQPDPGEEGEQQREINKNILFSIYKYIKYSIIDSLRV